jgi:hypothetical protein
MSKFLAISAGVLASVLVPALGVASTLAQMEECQNCTSTQMLNKAKHSQIGYVFVYDIPNHIIRKYETYMDSTCSQLPAPSLSTDNDQRQGDETQCGQFKDGVPAGPVDPDVQEVFDTLFQVWTVNPTLATTMKATYRGSMPIDTTTGQPFDLPRVAWDYPQGSYVRFVETIGGTLQTRNGANSLVPKLGDMMYGVNMGSYGVAIGIPPLVLDLHWDRNTVTVSLDMCDPSGNCAKFKVVPTGGEPTLTYLGVFDNEQNMWPSMSGTAPGSMTAWPFRLLNAADRFISGLRGNGMAIPDFPPCPAFTHEFLEITRQGGVPKFYRWSCVPNP